MAKFPDPGHVTFDMPKSAAQFWLLVGRVDKYLNASGCVYVADPSDDVSIPLLEAWQQFHTLAAAHVMSKAFPLTEPPDSEPNAGVEATFPRAA